MESDPWKLKIDRILVACFHEFLDTPKVIQNKKSPISLEKLSYGIYKLIMLSLLGVVRHAQACPKNFKITNWPFKVFWFFVVLVKSEGNFYGGRICVT